MAQRGRKSLKVEVDTNKLFTLSYFTLTRALNSKKISESKKADIALAIYTKHLPSKMEHTIPEHLIEKYAGIPVNEIIGKLNALIGKPTQS